MELTAFLLLLAAACLVGVMPTVTEAQKIVSLPSVAGYGAVEREQVQGRFPRREELLQALDFLEEYERGKANDWNTDHDDSGALYAGDAEADAFDLGGNAIYPEGLDLDFGQETEMYPDYGPAEDNNVDISPWLANLLLQGSPEDQEIYAAEVEQAEDLSEDLEDLLEALLVAEAEVEAAEEIDEAVAEETADIVEEEMEEMAVQNILDDIWAQEVLQEDAERELKWLLVEEEDRLEREQDQEKAEDGEDPFKFEYFSSDEEGLASDYGSDYSLSNSEEDFVGESLDEAEKEELREEAAEILRLQDQEKEEEELRARRILETLVGSLAEEAIQEEMEEEDAVEEDDEEEEEEGDTTSSLSVLDAGMVDGEPDEEEEEGVEQEVYNELVEFLENEIDQAIEDIADDILQALDEEKMEEQAEGEGEGVPEKEVEEADENGNSPGGTNVEQAAQEGEPDGDDECSSLQYFVDDCNIVNNYGDLGADGYKELFAGACNRHQLCYACGEYYDVGSKLCDELYKAEMLARCEADGTACKQRAKYFWLVARNNRIPAFESSPVCADPCVLSFLVEV
ncbi:uncharacterized protein LOC110988097 isoform X1 [Acanthaster planci]|uniref:Uncharacterized protein LOC110988097 isoform X1 n=1 Tax=Acanthaster planci TaxID=133434 RepID=A0A8B7ZN52_ACAPL|nr:uncharacterized protein LOC110988097 isoform X1 [Acanthaster planci]XP_022107032.1 uncharacterized protein LOC110988097 isoform X1 [Acanthaster planci]XP_022107033.1 uncharacterized protein LOC110988097 isoform X1 [Acanthaster planci]